MYAFRRGASGMRILKRFLTTDRAGRVLARNTERLTDDIGGVQVTRHTIAVRCPSCFRWLTDTNEQRGRCDYCRIRGCCVHCETKCRVCSRRLCGVSRRGFTGDSPSTVCPICFVRLHRRQAYRDQLLIQQASFQRSMSRQRESTRIQALRLRAAREQALGRLSVIREINRVKLALAKMMNNGRHLR